MHNGPGLKRQMCKNVNISKVHLSHGLTRMTDGTIDPLLLLHNVMSIAWVTDVEPERYALKSVCLYSILGFCFSSGNNDTACSGDNCIGAVCIIVH